MKRYVRSVMLLGVLLVVSGCLEPKGGGLDSYRGATAWPFVPVKMRVHPFTSVEYDAQKDSHVLEARIEMLDPAGDMTKAVGQFHFELYRVGRQASEGSLEGDLLYAWDAPLLSLDSNQRHFDPITRTYLFKLRLDRQPEPGSRLRVVAQFTDPGERHLTAEAELDYTGDKS